MAGVPKLSRRSRWAVPAGALVVVGAVMAGSLISVAQASPGLPSKTPAELLAQVADSVTPPLTGTVVETTSLGLPRLPGTVDPTSIASLLSGSHTVRVWYSSSRHFRLAVPESLSETDVIADGNTAWQWKSTANAVTQYALPADQSGPGQPLPDTSPTTAPLIPQRAAQQVLAAVGPTTTVRVDSNVTVAGEPASQLVLAPKDARSRIGQVQIAIDGKNGVPLRLQVYARDASRPAFQVGYTVIQFVAPASADLTFSPPPGATVDHVSMTGQSGTSHKPGDVSVIGSGWLSVLDLPSAGLTAPGASGPAPGNGGSGAGVSGDSNAVLNALLRSATPVSGAWGTGKLLQTSLISVLITDSGRTFVGAVQPSVLYAAASQTPASQAPASSATQAP
jgi:outer membrane lipoprotein-sorting protein